ncbi:hypothetical protein KIPB_006395 [Kipferlia bialata]|uniref:Uncharacterized protein n=1 Tax=Kipferlia bialata TaxID=797122 RepID=A0A9K3GJQ5_9EUKA|nr:hypothetical protein KIPB_006395 [Kipferlia bialata]|eukprot:g6395.t1
MEDYREWVANIHREWTLRRDIARLQRYRQAGITTFSDAQDFDKDRDHLNGELRRLEASFIAGYGECPQALSAALSGPGTDGKSSKRAKNPHHRLVHKRNVTLRPVPQLLPRVEFLPEGYRFLELCRSPVTYQTRAPRTKLTALFGACIAEKFLLHDDRKFTHSPSEIASRGPPVTLLEHRLSRLIGIAPNRYLRLRAELLASKGVITQPAVKHARGFPGAAEAIVVCIAAMQLSGVRFEAPESQLAQEPVSFHLLDARRLPAFPEPPKAPKTKPLRPPLSLSSKAPPVAGYTGVPPYGALPVLGVGPGSGALGSGALGSGALGGDAAPCAVRGGVPASVSSVPGSAPLPTPAPARPPKRRPITDEAHDPNREIKITIKFGNGGNVVLKPMYLPLKSYAEAPVNAPTFGGNMRRVEPPAIPPELLMPVDLEGETKAESAERERMMQSMAAQALGHKKPHIVVAPRPNPTTQKTHTSAKGAVAMSVDAKSLRPSVTDSVASGARGPKGLGAGRGKGSSARMATRQGLGASLRPRPQPAPDAHTLSGYSTLPAPPAVSGSVVTSMAPGQYTVAGGQTGYQHQYPYSTTHTPQMSSSVAGVSASHAGLPASSLGPVVSVHQMGATVPQSRLALSGPVSSAASMHAAPAAYTAQMQVQRGVGSTVHGPMQGTVQGSMQYGQQTAATGYGYTSHRYTSQPMYNQRPGSLQASTHAHTRVSPSGLAPVSGGHQPPSAKRDPSSVSK